MEPEVVATSPNRIKSPVPVCCGFDSKNEHWFRSQEKNFPTLLTALA